MTNATPSKIGHFADMPTRHRLYDRYSAWLDAIRAARARRGMDFKVLYGTSDLAGGGWRCLGRRADG